MNPCSVWKPEFTMPRLSTAQLAARREEILLAGFQCLAAVGFEATTLQKVAARAGLAVGTIYLYFDDKDALFEAIAELNQQRTEERLDQLASASDPLAAIEELIGEAFAGRNGRLELELFARATKDEEIGKWVKALVSQWEEALATVIRRARRAGQIDKGPHAKALARDVFALLNGAIMLEMLNPSSDHSRTTPARRARAAAHRLLGAQRP